jgi:hypothetical protein
VRLLRRIRQAGVGVGLGVAGDPAGGLGGLAKGRRAEVRGRRRALGLAEVHHEGHLLVPLVFQGVHLALAHGHAEPDVVADDHLGGGGAADPGVIEDHAYPLLQRGGTVRECLNFGCLIHAIHRFLDVRCGRLPPLNGGFPWVGRESRSCRKRKRRAKERRLRGSRRACSPRRGCPSAPGRRRGRPPSRGSPGCRA